MKFFAVVVAAVVTLVLGWTSQAAATESFSPLVDHHQHLLSPAIARMINGPMSVPPASLPPALAGLIAERNAGWNDPERLATIFTEDATVSMVGGTQSGLISGRGEVAAYLAARRRNPYRLVPTAYSQAAGSAWIVGYYTTGGQSGEPVVEVGQFQLGLRQVGGNWRIAAETPAFRTAAFQAPITGADLIKLLDEAGIQRAVVLSVAFTHGSRNFDFERNRMPAAERHALVRSENDWTAAEAARYAPRLVAFCSVGPTEAYALAEVRRCAASKRFAGLKLHLDESGVSLSDAEDVNRLRAVFALANELKLPIVIHVGNNTGPNAAANVQTFVTRVVSAAPAVPIQIAHLWGGGTYSPDAMKAYIAAANSGFGNLWFDMAEAPLMATFAGGRRDEVANAIADAIRAIGVRRVLFGSDISMAGHLAPKAAWAQFRELIPLSNEEFRVIASNVAPYLRSPQS